MKKGLRIALSVILFLNALIFLTSIVIQLSYLDELYYPATAIAPILFFLVIGVLSIRYGITLLLNRKNNKRGMLFGFILIIIFGILIRPINNAIINSWDKSVVLKYEGTELSLYGGTRLCYSITNITNHTLENIVIVFECEGFDEKGEPVKWDEAYETHKDIEPNNTISVDVPTSSIEKNDYEYWESDVKFLVFK